MRQFSHVWFAGKLKNDLLSMMMMSMVMMMMMSMMIEDYCLDVDTIYIDVLNFTQLFIVKLKTESGAVDSFGLAAVSLSKTPNRRHHLLEQFANKQL